MRTGSDEEPVLCTPWCAVVNNMPTLLPSASALDGSSFQKSQIFVPGSIRDSSLGIYQYSSEVAHGILRIHLFVHSKAGSYYTPLGMLQKNNINCRF